MEVGCKDKDPMRRILREAIRIKDAMEGEEYKTRVVEEGIEKEIKAKLRLLNSKREFHLPTLGAPKVRNITDTW